MSNGGLYKAIGDSTTCSGPASAESLYTWKTWREISNNYAPVEYRNRGIIGIKSDQMLNNFWHTNTDSADLVTVGIGMNDCQNGSMTTAQFKTNLNNIIDKLRQRNSEVHIILCTPSGTSDPTRKPYVQSFRTAMAEVATAKQVDICRFEQAWTDDNAATYTSDGVHPTAAGHQLLFNLILPIVQQGEWLTRL